MRVLKKKDRFFGQLDVFFPTLFPHLFFFFPFLHCRQLLLAVTVFLWRDVTEKRFVFFGQVDIFSFLPHFFSSPTSFVIGDLYSVLTTACCHGVFLKRGNRKKGRFFRSSRYFFSFLPHFFLSFPTSFVVGDLYSVLATACYQCVSMKRHDWKKGCFFGQVDIFSLFPHFFFPDFLYRQRPLFSPHYCLLSRCFS